MRTSDLALAVFPAVFPRLIDAEDREAMTALADTAGREVKVLVNQQGHSLLARGLYTGQCFLVQMHEACASCEIIFCLRHLCNVQDGMQPDVKRANAHCCIAYKEHALHTYRKHCFNESQRVHINGGVSHSQRDNDQ